MPFYSVIPLNSAKAKIYSYSPSIQTYTIHAQITDDNRCISPRPNPNTFIESAGTSLKGAVDILKNKGAVLDTLLPFHIANYLYTGDEKTFYASAATLKIASYFNLGNNVNNWRTWLAVHGPIQAALNSDATWDHATATQGRLDTFQPGTTRGGHCVAIVGYTADNRFIVRNSWGTTWGDQGFAYASEAYIDAAFFNESYGITL